MEYWLLNHPSFSALSANAKVVMIYMAKRFNGFNNGHIGFGWRAGCLVPINGQVNREINFGLSQHQVGRALNELEAAKFIICTKAATFDQKRLTREWRLAWLPSGLKGDRPAGKEFASIPPSKNLEARCTGASNPPLQVHQCTYEMDPIGPKELYRCTSAPHIVTMGCGGNVLPLPGAKTDAA